MKRSWSLAILYCFCVVACLPAQTNYVVLSGVIMVTCPRFLTH